MAIAQLLAVPALLLGLAHAAAALDGGRRTSQYVVTRWGARDLASTSVHALLQTRDRYLLLGTTAGLVRFDGGRFSPFTDGGAHGPGLPAGGVHGLSEGPDGVLYVGTSVGAVFEYRGGTFTRLAPDAAGAAHAIRPRADGSVWVAAHGRPAYRYKDGQGATLGSRNIDAAVAIAEDAAGRVWIGTGHGLLLRMDGDKTVGEEIRIGDAIQALHISRDGVFWLGTPHGLVRLEAGRQQRFTRRDGLSHDFVTAIREDRDGNLWIGTAGGGLNRLRDGRFSPLTSHEGLSNDHVRCLLEDHEGNLWVGTADGLDCVSDGRFVTFGRLEGLRDPAVTAVAGTSDGSIWIGTNSGGLTRLRQGELEHYQLPPGTGSDALIALHAARDGGLWAVADNGRVFRVRGRHIEEHTPVYAGRKVRFVYEDHAGAIFFVTGIGPVRVDGRRTRPLYTPSPTLGYFHTAYRDASGTLWAGTSVGLVRIEDETFAVLRQRDGLPHDRVRSITGEPDGGLWIATIGGLGYVKGDVRRKLTTAEGLPENYLRLVIDDGLGYLWIASMGHVFRVEKREIHDVFAGRIPRVSPVTFDTWDGLRATEAAALSNSPGFRGVDGRLWLATAQGVSVVDPRGISVDDPAPRVIIEGLTVDGQKIPGGTYPPGRGEVTIDYAALAFRSPGKLLFRQRLEGFDERWVDAGTRRSAYYSNLPPGRYRFSVTASNRHGRWNGEATTVEFALRPPFYRRTAFYLACFAAVSAVAAIAHRLRVRAMHARLTAIIHERTRIARELHDTLAQGLAGVGLQLHTAMSILPRQPGLDRVRGQLEQAHSMIRNSLAEVRRSIWVLRAQTAKDAQDLATSLSSNLAQLTADSGTGSSFEVRGEPRPLSPDLERNLLRIAHEAVTNAVRHSGATHIAIVLEFDREHVRLRVRDDGRGFDPEAALRRTAGEHFGLVGIAERTKSLGGEIALLSRPGDGAEIDCRLPYHPSEPDTVQGATP